MEMQKRYFQKLNLILTEWRNDKGTGETAEKTDDV